jgi:hypothetical protein
MDESFSLLNEVEHSLAVLYTSGLQLVLKISRSFVRVEFK